jgi:hypothetical protein
MTEKALDDLDAVRTIVETLRSFKPDEQQRIFRWVVEKTGLPQISLVSSIGGSAAPSPVKGPILPASSPHSSIPVKSVGVDIKSFIDEKRPRSDVQFAATVAYYLRFEAPTDERKDAINKEDLQEACRKAKRDRLKIPYQTLLNAHKLGLLDKGSEKATFAINTVGENLVAMSLPGEGKMTSKPEVKRRIEKTKKAVSKKAPVKEILPVKKTSAKKVSKRTLKV